jgi:plasmid stabilization system protein ParE
VKLHLGKRLRRQIANHEAWWAENRPAAPDLFAREFRDKLDLIRRNRHAGEDWPTKKRPTLQRILMPDTKNHIYFRVDEKRKVIHVLAVWGAAKNYGPML